MIGGLGGIGALVGTMLGGPLGGVLAQLMTQAVSAVAQQIVQQAGDAIGAPQSMIDMAQGHVAGALGDPEGAGRNLEESIEAYGKEVGTTPSQIGDVQRQVSEQIQKAGEEAMQTDEAKEAKAGGAGGKGGWLHALAQALGKAADKAAADLEQKASKLDGATPSQSAEYSADAQAFGMLMNAINQAIKTIGESLNTVARKG